MSEQLSIFDFMKSPENVSGDIKRLIQEQGYKKYFQPHTRISLESVDFVQGKSQIAVVLLTDDVMTFITFRQDGTSFKSWEISPTTNKHFNEFKQNLFCVAEGLSTLSHRTIDVIVKEYYERFAS